MIKTVSAVVTLLLIVVAISFILILFSLIIFYKTFKLMTSTLYENKNKMNEKRGKHQKLFE